MMLVMISTFEGKFNAYNTIEGCNFVENAA